MHANCDVVQISDERVFEAYRRAGELQWMADDAVPAAVRCAVMDG